MLDALLVAEENNNYNMQKSSQKSLNLSLNKIIQYNFVHNNNYSRSLVGNINNFFNFSSKFENLFNNIYKALLEFIRLILQDIIVALNKVMPALPEFYKADLNLDKEDPTDQSNFIQSLPFFYYFTDSYEINIKFIYNSISKLLLFLFYIAFKL